MRLFTIVAVVLFTLGGALTGASFESGVSLATPALAAPDAGGHGDDSHGDESHGEGHGGGHAAGPWEDDNHNGVANFFDAEDEHYANSWGHPVYLQWVWHLLNLLVLVGGIAFLARKPVAAALRDRFLGIKKDLDESAEVEQVARSRYEELERRLASFEDEVAQMKADAAKAAAVEKQEADARARDAVARVKESAERTIRDEAARATRALRAEAVDLAVQLAEETLRNEVGAADRQRLARDLLTTLGANGGTHG